MEPERRTDREREVERGGRIRGRWEGKGRDEQVSQVPMVQIAKAIKFSQFGWYVTQKHAVQVTTLRRGQGVLREGFHCTPIVCPSMYNMYDGAFEQVEFRTRKQTYVCIYDLHIFLCSSKSCLLSDTLKETGDIKHEEVYIIAYIPKAICPNCTVMHSAVLIALNYNEIHTHTFTHQQCLV